MMLDNILSWAAIAPQQVAYQCRDGVLTYQQLADYARKLAGYFTETLPPKEPVLVFGHKQLLMPVCFLAAALSGRAYIPADDSIPPARLASMIQQAKPARICALSPLPLEVANMLDGETLNRICQSYPVSEKLPGLEPKATFYVIFTSGSTGEPKGVRVSYRSADQYINWLCGLLSTRGGRVLNTSIFSFDLSVTDLYFALTTGQTFYPLEWNLRQNLPAMLDTLKKANPTLAVMTPSFAEILLSDKAFVPALSSLQEIFFCGESLKPALVRRLFGRFPGLRVFNAYGPTECTVAVSAAEVFLEENANCLPVGPPRPGTGFLLLNDKGEITDREEGELLIVGESVAQGYLTGEGDFCRWQDKPAYRTGDLAIRKEGTWYIKGRVDRQIKYKGCRIELDDIEQNLLTLDAVRQAAVLALRGAEGQAMRLAAFIRTECVVSEGELRAALSRRLPEYMLPRVIMVEDIPMTLGGKCDYQALEESLRTKLERS